MKKLLFFTLLILLSYKNSMAQLTQTIKGTITDRSSGLALPGVTIKLISVNSFITTVSDSTGVFRLTGAPVGRHTVEISCTGYQTTALSDVLTTTGRQTELNIELEPQNKQLSEVAVNATSGKRPLNSMSMASARSFSPEETNRYAGGFFDPARMAQSFAGVVAGGDNNEIVVRGNSPKSLEWRLEGIEIVNPNHFSNEGAAGGSMSMLNSAVLGTSDFYTGGLPAEYSNADAGVFDLRFRKGNTDRNEYSLSIGVLGAGATLEGPFKKGGNASYLISYRYSSLDLLQKAGLLGSLNGVPKYQDLSFNFVFPTKGAGTFSLFGIGGLSSLDVSAKRDFSTWKERDDGSNFINNYRAGSIGFKHVYSFNSKLYLTNIISYNNEGSSGTADTLTHEYASSLTQKNRYGNTAFRYAGTVNYQPGAADHIRAGINAGLLGFNLYDLEYRQDTHNLQQLLNKTGNAGTFDGFIEDKHDFGNGLTMNTGLHSNYFNLSNSWTIEPRIGLNYQLPANQLLSLALGSYSRLESLSYYFAQNPNSPGLTNNHLEPTKSAEAVVGYEKLFDGNLKFKTEVYYQHLYDVPVSANPADNFSLLNVSDNSNIGSADYTSLVNKGTGKNYGTEFSLEKSLSSGYYFILNTTFSDSKFTALSGQEYNTAFDSKFAANMVVGKEWAASKNKKNLFGLNAKFIYAGGRKYSPINLAESQKLNKQVIDEARINTLTADAYVRVDFSASYRINGNKVAHYILLDIQNLLNRQNNIGLFYNPSKHIIEKNKWIGIVPTLTYRVEF